jgi:hypothetical protein
MAEEARKRLFEYETSYAVVFRDAIKDWMAAHPLEDRPAVTPKKAPVEYDGPAVNPSFKADPQLISDGKLYTRAYGTSLQRVCVEGLERWLSEHPPLGAHAPESRNGQPKAPPPENRTIELLEEILARLKKLEARMPVAAKKRRAKA